MYRYPNQHAGSCREGRTLQTRWSTPMASCQSERGDLTRSQLSQLLRSAFFPRSAHSSASRAVLDLEHAAFSPDTRVFIRDRAHSPVTNATINSRERARSIDTRARCILASAHLRATNAIFDFHSALISLDTSARIPNRRPSTQRFRVIFLRLRWQDSSAPPSARTKNCRHAEFGRRSRPNSRAISRRGRI